MLRLEDAADAATAVNLAGSHGFGELWIETHSDAVLKEAVRAAQQVPLKVRLVIRPFEPKPGSKLKDPDLTILGDTGAALEARKVQMPNAGSRSGKAAMMGVLTESATPPFYFPPTHVAIESGLREALELAKVAGLSGVVVLGTQPRGYEPGRSREQSGVYSSERAALHEFGYSIDMRRAFLRLYSADPIDVVPPALMFTGELRRPFFLDDALRGLPTSYNGLDLPIAAVEALTSEWDEYRSKANQKVIEPFLTELAKAAGDVPVMVEARTRLHNDPPSYPYLVSWRSSMKLSAIEVGWVDGRSTLPEAMVFPFAEIANPDSTIFLARILRGETGLKCMRTVDVSAVPAAELIKLLDVWFRKGP